MRMLRSVFGPSKDEIWSQVAHDIGGQYEAGGILGRDVLRYRSGEWEITLDTYTTGSEASHTYTRLRAPFLKKDGLSFIISREGVLSSIHKFFGGQDIHIHDPEFDETFRIRGNNTEKVRQLLNEPRLKQLIRAEECGFRIRKDAGGLFREQFPEGVAELYFECYGVVKDKERLKNLFDLFSLTLQRLVQIDSAYEADPHVTL